MASCDRRMNVAAVGVPECFLTFELLGARHLTQKLLGKYVGAGRIFSS